MHWLGRMRRCLALGMVAAVLLSGCGSVGECPASSSVQLTEEENDEETMAQELQKQIMAVLNLRRPLEDRMTSDSALEQAAAFFLTYVLQDPDINPTEVQNPTDLDGMLTDQYTYAFVYNGALSAAQAGKKILESLEQLDTNPDLLYMEPQSIAIAYGRREEKSVWLMLVLYPVDDIDTGAEDSGAGNVPET